MAAYKAPGRLGDPEMTLATEPRVHAGQLEALRQLGIHGPAYLTAEIAEDASLDVIRAVVEQNEKSLEELLDSMDYSRRSGSATPSITCSEHSVPGEDGMDVKLTVRRPVIDAAKRLPAIIHFHSGGMVILKTSNRMHVTWNEELARSGLITVAVDFRNAISPGRHDPFPAGLHDCVRAVQWVHANREQLGIRSIVLEGESGGGNLAMSVALKALREGRISAIDGVVATQPYISGAYNMPLEWKLRELPSLVECDGYLISCSTSTINARLYDPDGQNARNPLAWPYWASTEELRGLPPHLIITNELDPLRDEGNAYYRKLVTAGVRATARTNLGLVHEAELFMRQTLPDMFMLNLHEVKAFAEAL